MYHQPGLPQGAAIGRITLRIQRRWEENRIMRPMAGPRGSTPMARTVDAEIIADEQQKLSETLKDAGEGEGGNDLVTV